MAELEFERELGRLALATDAQAALDKLIVTLKTPMLNMPSKLAQRLSHKEPKEIEEVLRNEVNEILSEAVDRYGSEPRTTRKSKL